MDYQLISVLTLGVAMVGTASLYLKTRFDKSKIVAREEEIVEGAKRKAERIINEAQERALKVLGEARLGAENRNKKLETRLDRIEDKEVREFKKALGDVATSVEGEATVVVGQKIDEEVAKARVEIEKYKQLKLKQVDDNIGEIVKETVKKVLGKGITALEHKDLVLQALQEAKENHVL
ncbi:MAG: hypothetical protein AAB697_01410 [Patescibacteria group bacterium]|mgnify:CR=1